MPDYGGPSGFGNGDPGGGGPGGSGGRSGSGDHSGGMGSASGANVGGSGASAADQAALDAAKAAIASGKNPFASSTQQSIAQGLVDRGFFGGRDDSPQGITGLLTNLFGYDEKKSLVDNIIDITVPGRNTPLGILSAAVPGLTEAQQIGLGLANATLGKLGIGSTPTARAEAPSSISQGILDVATPDSELATSVADQIQARANIGG